MAERKSILLRIRPDLYDALQRWAQDEIRSVNGQIEYLLEQSLRQAGRTPKATRRGLQGPPAPPAGPGAAAAKDSESATGSLDSRPGSDADADADADADSDSDSAADPDSDSGSGSGPGGG